MLLFNDPKSWPRSALQSKPSKFSFPFASHQRLKHNVRRTFLRAVTHAYNLFAEKIFIVMFVSKRIHTAFHAGGKSIHSVWVFVSFFVETLPPSVVEEERKKQPSSSWSEWKAICLVGDEFDWAFQLNTFVVLIRNVAWSFVFEMRTFRLHTIMFSFCFSTGSLRGNFQCFIQTYMLFSLSNVRCCFCQSLALAT